MRLNIMLFVAVLAVAILFVPALDVSALELDQIRAQQQTIRTDIVAGKGRYAGMSAGKRNEILARQKDLLRLIEGRTTESELSENERMLAFNSLEWIEAAINNAEDERVVCKSEKPTGSNRAQRICRTVAQMREEREASERLIDRRAVCSEGAMCAGK
jgi:hypothetical protein